MKEYYQKTAVRKLAKELAIPNVLALPSLQKVVVASGLGRLLSSAAKPADFLEEVQNELALITAQRPAVTVARKSIASFKIRAGQSLGLKVTLRGQRMYDFLDRLIHIALPRSRDFKGIPLKAVDGAGNLTIGLREQTIFPETADSAQSFGLEITVVASAKSRSEAIQLFRSLGFPLKEE